MGAVVRRASEDKKRVRLNIISHLLSRVPYKALPREKVKLPKRKVARSRRPIRSRSYPRSSDVAAFTAAIRLRTSRIECRSKRTSGRCCKVRQNMIRARDRPVMTATAVATTPGIMNEWLSTYLPIFVVPDRSKLIAAISEP